MKLIFLLLIINNSYALDKAVYGVDDRVELHEASTHYQDLAKATAGMIRLSTLKDEGDSFSFEARSLGSQIMGNQFRNGYLCSDERFYSQETLTSCSGFLVSATTLMTAGHCVRTERDCESFVWSFGLGLSKVRSRELLKNEVYKCKSILKRGDGPKDYALIELDREVKGTTPLTLSKKKTKNGDSVFSIGHPSNLPLKFAMNGKIKRSKDGVLVTDLDTFSGNSGSPVLLQSSREVIGILVRGAEDYIKDMDRGCFIVNSCRNFESDGNCYGESVTPVYKLLE